MFVTFLKYIALIICSLYIYLKLQHITSVKKLYFSFILLILLILPVIELLRIYVPSLSIFITVLLFAFYLCNVFKTPLNLSLTTSVISFGISYFTFLIATVILSPIGCFLDSFLNKYTSNIVTMLCIGVIQYQFTTIPFKMKRFKKGMPFLHEYRTSDTGVYISILLLLAASFFGISKEANLVFIIPVFFTIVCGLTLLFWWRNSLTKKYIEQITSREFEALQSTILQNNKQIEQLKYHNDELSKIIHKDNKLIPAMEYAVREYLLSAEHEIGSSDYLIRGKELLDQLISISQERKGIINTYEVKTKKLSSTNVPSVDTLLSYMLQKAIEYQINLDVSVSESLKYLVDHFINESDIKTLLADLIDNAIIATKKCSKKNIIVNLGIISTFYSIDIIDSGDPFSIDTLLNLAVTKTTTHEEEGGSGIGLMTTFDILKKYQASFLIEEFSYHDLYSKKVSIFFDNLGQIRIKTMRTDVKKALSSRTDIILVHDLEMKMSTNDNDLVLNCIR